MQLNIMHYDKDKEQHLHYKSDFRKCHKDDFTERKINFVEDAENRFCPQLE
jgi:hypothetical protein